MNKVYRVLWLLILVIVIHPTLAETNGSQAQAESPAFTEENLRTFVKETCYRCHGEKKQKADRRFDTLSFDLSDDDNLAHWQDILDQLNLGEMPPDEEDHPEPEQLRQIVAFLTSSIAKAQESRKSHSQQPVLRRLNHREYLNTIRDLARINTSLFDPTEGFPEDDIHEGFDNLGENLIMSEYLLNKYFDTADEIIEKAIKPGPRPEVKNWDFKPPFDKTTKMHAGWVYFERRHTNKYQSIFQGTKERGGYRAIDAFKKGVPHDGWYKIRIRACGLHRQHKYDRGLIGTDVNEPIRLALVSGAAKFGPMHLKQPSEKTLAVFDLPDNQPEWVECTVWLEKGYQPRMTYQNGPYFFKELSRRVLKKYKKIGVKYGYENWLKIIQKINTPQIRIFDVNISGPHFKAWPPPSHVAIMGKEPYLPENTRKIIKRFAERAFRRPVNKDEVNLYMDLFQQNQKDGDAPLQALKNTLKAILCSPNFIYIETDPDVISKKAGDAEIVDEESGEKKQETDTKSYFRELAIATRLSYFLWSSMPDNELMRLAFKGQLSKPSVLYRQTERMLKHKKAQAFIENFPDRWLHLYKLGEMPPDVRMFQRYYTGEMEPAMRKETHLFFNYLLSRNMNIGLFLDSNFTFVNQALANHYGISLKQFQDAKQVGKRTPTNWMDFRQVKLGTKERGGLFGQASVLTLTANGIDTSPVLRGVWVLDNILGTPPSPPPPDVEPIEPDIRGSTSIRDQFKKHRNVATCNECHKKIDPLGFALEGFDAIGTKRSHYDRQRKLPVDTKHEAPNGKPLNGVIGLKQLLLYQKPLFARCLTEKMLTYATGRELTILDRPTIDKILEIHKQKGHGLRDLVHLIVQSDIFLAE